MNLFNAIQMNTHKVNIWFVKTSRTLNHYKTFVLSMCVRANAVFYKNACSWLLNCSTTMKLFIFSLLILVASVCSDRISGIEHFGFCKGIHRRVSSIPFLYRFVSQIFAKFTSHHRHRGDSRLLSTREEKEKEYIRFFSFSTQRFGIDIFLRLYKLFYTIVCVQKSKAIVSLNIWKMYYIFSEV